MTTTQYRPFLVSRRVSSYIGGHCEKRGDAVRCLVVDDSVAWHGLKEEFDIRTSEGVTSWMGDIDEPQKRVKRNVRPAWRAMAVHADRTIAFYRIEDSVQYQALLDYQLDELVNR